MTTIGHNQAPDEVEIVKQRLSEYAEIPLRLDVLAKTEIPTEIADDLEAAKTSDYIGSVKNLFDEVKKVFKKEKDPFWEAGKAADAWKNGYELKTNALIEKAEKTLLVWNQKKRKLEEERLAAIAKKAREDAEKLAAEAAAHEDAGIQDTAEELMSLAINAETKADRIEAGDYAIRSVSRGSFSSSSLKTETVGKMESLATIDLNALKNFFKEQDIQDAINRSIKAGISDITGVIYSQEDKLTTRRG